jgi:hypothetical protein
MNFMKLFPKGMRIQRHLRAVRDHVFLHVQGEAPWDLRGLSLYLVPRGSAGPTCSWGMVKPPCGFSSHFCIQTWGYAQVREAVNMLTSPDFGSPQHLPILGSPQHLSHFWPMASHDIPWHPMTFNFGCSRSRRRLCAWSLWQGYLESAPACHLARCMLASGATKKCLR